MKLLLFAALPRELKEVLRTFERVEPLRGFLFPVYGCRLFSHEVLVVETGVGIAPARRAFEQALAFTGVEGVVSAGYCGALTPESRPADVIWGSELRLVGNGTMESLVVPDSRRLLPELAVRVPAREGTIVTAREWMKKADMLRLVVRPVIRPVCDMETFMLARLSLERGIPFYAMRSVSDGAEQEVRFNPAMVCDAAGRYRPAKAVTFFVRRPHLLGHALRLGLDSTRASRTLARAVHALLRIL